MVLPDVREPNGDELKYANITKRQQHSNAGIRNIKQMQVSYHANADDFRKRRRNEGVLPDLDLSHNQVVELQEAARKWKVIEPVRRVWVPKTMLKPRGKMVGKRSRKNKKGSKDQTKQAQRRHKAQYLLESPGDSITSPFPTQQISYYGTPMNKYDNSEQTRAKAGPAMDLSSPSPNKILQKSLKRRRYIPATANQKLAEQFDRELQDRSDAQLDMILGFDRHEPQEGSDGEDESGPILSSELQTAGALIRRTYQAYRQRVKQARQEEEAILVMQCFSRCFLSRLSVHARKKYLKESHAALVIQRSIARPLLAHQKVHNRKMDILYAKKRAAAATLINSRALGYMQRIHFLVYRHAVIRLQAQQRGVSATAAYAKRRKQIVRHQALFRGVIERRNISRKNEAVTRIQAVIRTRQARNLRKQLRAQYNQSRTAFSVLRLQKWFRQQQAIQQLLYKLEARTIAKQLQLKLEQGTKAVLGNTAKRSNNIPKTLGSGYAARNESITGGANHIPETSGSEHATDNGSNISGKHIPETSGSECAVGNGSIENIFGKPPFHKYTDNVCVLDTLGNHLLAHDRNSRAQQQYRHCFLMGFGKDRPVIHMAMALHMLWTQPDLGAIDKAVSHVQEAKQMLGVMGVKRMRLKQKNKIVINKYNGNIKKFPQNKDKSESDESVETPGNMLVANDDKASAEINLTENSARESSIDSNSEKIQEEDNGPWSPENVHWGLGWHLIEALLRESRSAAEKEITDSGQYLDANQENKKNEKKKKKTKATSDGSSQKLRSMARRGRLASTLVQWALGLQHICNEEELAGEFMDRALAIAPQDSSIRKHHVLFNQIFEQRVEAGEFCAQPVFKREMTLSGQRGVLLCRRRGLNYEFHFTPGASLPQPVLTATGVLNSPVKVARLVVRKGTIYTSSDETKDGEPASEPEEAQTFPPVTLTIRKQQVIDLANKLDDTKLLTVPYRNRLAVVMSRMLRYNALTDALSVAFQAAPFPIVTQLTPSGQFVSVLAVPTEARGFVLTVSNSSTNERYTLKVTRDDLQELLQDESGLLKSMDRPTGWRVSSRKVISKIAKLVDVRPLNLPTLGDVVVSLDPSRMKQNQISAIKEHADDFMLHVDDTRHPTEYMRKMARVTSTIAPLRFGRVTNCMGSMLSVSPLTLYHAGGDGSNVGVLTEPYLLIQVPENSETKIDESVVSDSDVRNDDPHKHIPKTSQSGYAAGNESSIAGSNRIPKTSGSGYTVGNASTEGGGYIIELTSCRLLKQVTEALSRDGTENRINFEDLNVMELMSNPVKLLEAIRSVPSGGNRKGWFRDEYTMYTAVLMRAERIREAHKNMAARGFQRLFRGYTGRERVVRIRQNLGAISFQRGYRRRFLCLKRAHVLARGSIRDKAALRIQRACRCAYARAVLSHRCEHIFQTSSWIKAMVKLRLPQSRVIAARVQLSTIHPVDVPVSVSFAGGVYLHAFEVVQLNKYGSFNVRALQEAKEMYEAAMEADRFNPLVCYSYSVLIHLLAFVAGAGSGTGGGTRARRRSLWENSVSGKVKSRPSLIPALAPSLAAVPAYTKMQENSEEKNGDVIGKKKNNKDIHGRQLLDSNTNMKIEHSKPMVNLQRSNAQSNKKSSRMLLSEVHGATMTGEDSDIVDMDNSGADTGDDETFFETFASAAGDNEYTQPKSFHVKLKDESDLEAEIMRKESAKYNARVTHNKGMRSNGARRVDQIRGATSTPALITLRRGTGKYVTDIMLREAFEQGVSSDAWERAQDCLEIARVADPRNIKFTTTTALYFERCVLMHPGSPLACLQLGLVRWLAEDDVTSGRQLCEKAMVLASLKLDEWNLKNKLRNDSPDEENEPWGCPRSVLVAAETAAKAMQTDFEYHNTLATAIQRAWRSRVQRPEARGVAHARGCHSISLEWTMCRVRLGRALKTREMQDPKDESLGLDADGNPFRENKALNETTTSISHLDRVSFECFEALHDMSVAAIVWHHQYILGFAIMQEACKVLEAILIRHFVDEKALYESNSVLISKTRLYLIWASFGLATATLMCLPIDDRPATIKIQLAKRNEVSDAFLGVIKRACGTDWKEICAIPKHLANLAGFKSPVPIWVGDLVHGNFQSEDDAALLFRRALILAQKSNCNMTKAFENFPLFAGIWASARRAFSCLKDKSGEKSSALETSLCGFEAGHGGVARMTADISNEEDVEEQCGQGLPFSKIFAEHAHNRDVDNRNIRREKMGKMGEEYEGDQDSSEDDDDNDSYDPLGNQPDEDSECSHFQDEEDSKVRQTSGKTVVASALLSQENNFLSGLNSNEALMKPNRYGLALAMFGILVYRCDIAPEGLDTSLAEHALASALLTNDTHIPTIRARDTLVDSANFNKPDAAYERQLKQWEVKKAKIAKTQRENAKYEKDSRIRAKNAIKFLSESANFRAEESVRIPRKGQFKSMQSTREMVEVDAIKRRQKKEKKTKKLKLAEEKRKKKKM